MAAVPECPQCAGSRPYCIHRSYPLPRPDWIARQVQEQLKKEFSGPAHSVFVGRQGYPDVRVGPLAGLLDNPLLDNPAAWFGKPYSEIIAMRSFLVRGKQEQNVFSRARFVRDTQELALAKRPTETEITFAKTPRYRFTLSERLQPMGPSGDLVKLRITENTRIGRPVERVAGSGLKAAAAVGALHAAGQDVYKITAILSSGALGQDAAKKLVPTRWSITATDDLVAKELMGQIRGFPEIADCLVFESQYMDNHFIVLALPGSWEFENFEAWAPGPNWSKEAKSRIIQEYEPFAGRTRYAARQAGGYYASRLGVAEGLARLRKQARVVVFREVSEGYTIPLGVWVVRETVRDAMRRRPERFLSVGKALASIRPRLRLRLEDYAQQSVVLRRKTLRDFLRR